MTECERLADRMPAVASGRESWGPAEAAHLASCAGCLLEWKVVSAAWSTGAGVAAALDTTRVAEQVRRRLAEPEAGIWAVPRRVWRLAGLAAAAAVTLMVWPLRSPAPAPGTVPVPMAAVSVLHELDDLTPAELESVLESIPETASSIEHVDQGGFEDLDAHDLEQMLHTLEG